MEPDDLDLFSAWCDGDKAAGSALFHRYFASIYRFFRQTVNGVADAEELVQDTFLSCVHNKDKFRRDGAFRSFLFGIARHRLYAYWRRKARQGQALDFNETSVEDLVTTPATRMAKDEDRHRLYLALRGLPLEQQLLLMLHYWENMDQNALARVFDVAPATTRSRLFRARQALRSRMGAMEEESGMSRREDADLEAWARALRDDLDAADPPSSGDS